MQTYIYLITLPIVIILGLAGMIYLVSRKSSEIEKKEKEKDNLGQEKRSIKEKISNFGLRLLERFTRWFKIISLKIHNHTEKWLSKISQKRLRYQEKREKKQENNSAIKISSYQKKKSTWLFWKNFKKKEDQKKKDELIQTEEKKMPLSSNKENSFSENNPSLDINRSTISKKIVYPQRKKKKGELEKILIERIAINPKDIEAYERLGNYYEETEAWSDAEACYAQVLKLSSNNYKVKMRLERVQRIIRKARYQ